MEPGLDKSGQDAANGQDEVIWAETLSKADIISQTVFPLLRWLVTVLEKLAPKQHLAHSIKLTTSQLQNKPTIWENYIFKYFSI